SLNTSCACGPAGPLPMRSKGNAMKHSIALIASVCMLIGALSVSTVFAQDKAADQKAAAPAVTAPAPATTAPDAKAEPAKAEPAAPAAPAAPDKPTLVAADKINSGD